MEPLLARLALSVSGAENLEGLTRPLLELLETVTGMESTYLTTIDQSRGVQHILFARNTQQMVIPEGLDVPWDDTLCKRALEEDRPYTDEVSSCWGDSVAAKAIGLQTYLSQPVRNLDGGLYGTLCAASGRKVSVANETIKVLGLFARLIAHQVERESLVEKLRLSNEELSSHALVDSITGIANRRALTQELKRMLARLDREGGRICVAFIDLDGFKGINDQHGHDVGDRFLAHIARRLSSGMRAGDLVARYGGDEFVVVAASTEAGDLRERLEALTQGLFTSGGIRIDYAGPSIGVVEARPGELDVEALLSRADAAMYEVKKTRRSGR